MRNVLITLSLLIFSLNVNAEEIKTYKGTDIYLFDFDIKSNNILSNGKNITKREGYDNQPYFSHDSNSIVYSSILDKQSDIYKYDLKSSQISQLTNTSDVSEYSPIFTPNSNDMSVVMVEKDGSQRLWKYSPDGVSKLVIEDIAPVGYYSWVNENIVSMFVLGEHNTLHIMDKLTGQHNVVKADIGRSIHKIPNKNAISFVHKINKKTFVIKSLSIDNLKEEDIITTLNGSEDYVWTPDGKILMGNKSDLFIFDPKIDKTWKKIVNLKNLGITDILRLAISPDGKKIALVSNIP
jgi:hypothetical protein